MPQNVPFRVVLIQGGVARKFFSLYEGGDGSLYIHPNRDGPWIRPKLEETPRGTSIDIANSVHSDFDIQKISLHRSGIIHVSNQRRERLRDGIRGTSFDLITPPYPLCVIVPAKLEKMPEFKGDRKAAVVNIEIPEDVDPFYMTISICNAEGIEGGRQNRISPEVILPLKSARD